MVNIIIAEILEASLPAEKMPKEQETEPNKTSAASPVNKRVSEEIVFDHTIIPRAHTQTNVENWPLPELGSQVILLVGIRDQCIIRSHHGHIQVNEIFQEGGLVGAGVTRWYYTKVSE